MADRYLLEDGSGAYLLEDGSGVLLIDVAPTTLDPANKHSNASLSGGNLALTGVNSNAAQCARTTSQVPVGSKLYFEVAITTLDATPGFVTLGCSDGLFDFVGTFNTPAQAGNGAGLGSNGYVYPSITFGNIIEATAGVLQCVIKRTSSTAVRVWIGYNNSWVGDPSAETGGETFTLGDTNCYGYVSVNRVDTATARFTSASQSFAPPTGATAWDDAAVSGTAIGLSTETDTALGLAIAIGAGRAAETDTAFALAAVQIRAVGLSSETDTAFALTGVQKRAAGLATETDTALGLGLARGVGLSVETDSALALSGKLIRAIGLSTETDTAFALTMGGLGVGLCIETDIAFARGIAMGIGRATETDTALGRGIAVGAGRASETDTAFALTYLLARPVGLASETDTALALAAVQRRPISAAVETDIALGRGLALGYAPANDNSTAFALAVVIIGGVVPAPTSRTVRPGRGGRTIVPAFAGRTITPPRRTG